MRAIRFEKLPENPPQLTWPFVSRILKYFSPYPFRLLTVIVLILSSSALGLVPALLTQKIIDVALPEKNLGKLALFVGVSLLATIILNFLGVLQGYLSTWIAKKITFSIKNDMYNKLSHMPQSFFAELKDGEILTRLTSDVDGIQQVFQTTIINAMTSVFILGTSLVALFNLNPLLALISIATIPLFIFPTKKVGKLRFKITSESQKQLSQLNSHVQESLSPQGSLLMKLFTNEKKANENFVHVNEKVTQLQIKETLAGRWFRMTMSIFTTIGPMLVYLVGGYLFIQGEMTIGSILTFATLLSRMYSPVTQLSNIQVDFMRSFALFDRIFTYLDLKPETNTHISQGKITQGEIIFDQVNFGYEKNTTLKNISTTFEKGETTAIVGLSGAGKSTLTNLIPRLITPSSGEIFIDGENIKHFSLEYLRQHIGFVSQESFLLNTTIKENLLYAKKEATEEELIAACKASFLHDFIVSLPEGYNTPVGNRGVKLSGGEKQRLAIARVILKNPQIIILDEATAALDTLSEYYVQKVMDELMKNRTAIVIAHRLATIKNAKKIIVMEQGKIVESGTQDELLRKNGLYEKLYHTQFKNHYSENISTQEVA